eukprot:Awhi_evm1s13406
MGTPSASSLVPELSNDFVPRAEYDLLNSKYEAHVEQEGHRHQGLLDAISSLVVRLDTQQRHIRDLEDQMSKLQLQRLNDLK